MWLTENQQNSMQHEELLKGFTILCFPWASFKAERRSVPFLKHNVPC